MGIYIFNISGGYYISARLISTIIVINALNVEYEAAKEIESNIINCSLITW